MMQIYQPSIHGSYLMGKTMQGTRIFLNDGEDYHLLEPGEYAVSPADGNWYAAVPVLRPQFPHVLVANLHKHKVEEHEDGTITVEPSILVMGYDNDCELRWHGYLEKGIWRAD